MDTLRKQKRKLKKHIRAASSEETNGLLVIWRQLKARHSALSRAESARKKRSQKRKIQGCFIRDPFQFARQLFQQPKSGTLTVEREELETHLKKTLRSHSRGTLGRNYRPSMASCPRNKARQQASKLTGSHSSSKQS
ncbi:reverse transcriptase [Plakobranchus ocellatus]|uniref:Reverse transcriptase n=1 Tax=Plakobranchus ocellatus TaxID=259542 RepID=A0AAV3YGQ0_9GAST|nr:reverse transcriptase [Plakobranchus ocellatus]